jgi:hypothetical protein
MAAWSAKCFEAGLPLWPPARMLLADPRPEFDGGDEAVAAVAVDALGLLLGHHAERGQRTPVGRGEGDRPARLAVVVLLVDVAADALEAVDLAPGRLPGAEVGASAFRWRAPAHRGARRVRGWS